MLILLLTGAILIYTYPTLSSNYIKTLKDSLKKINYSIEGTVRNNYKSQDTLDNKIKKLSKKINVRVTVVDNVGRVLADSYNEPEKMENHLNRVEIKNAKNGNIGHSIRYSTTENKKMIYVATPINIENREIYIRSSLYYDNVKKLINNLFYKILFILILIIIISIFVAVFFTKGITLPLNKLTDASNRVANGDFDVSVNVKNKDEFKILADSFNYMTDQINNLFGKLNENKRKLEAIINSIQEILFVIDKNKKFKLTNRNFESYIGKQKLINKLYYRIIDEPVLLELIDKVISTHDNLMKEIELNDKIYIISITYVNESKDIIVVLHDLTKLKRLNKIKKDFVYNASHELKTPLTAIKGFSETMIDNDSVNMNYVKIIKKNTDRMIQIVKDLLTLSELEISKNIEFGKIDLRKPINNSYITIKEKAEKKGLTLKKSFKGKNFDIMGDSFKLEQLFINLLDNAVKYTKEGEITINCREFDKYIEIILKDTGIGIPKKFQERIFERFFVVDKNRSRQKGGTGLGLSIVKHIVKLHDGEIEIDSHLGLGTIFVIQLKKYDNANKDI